jgi:hypothetical protein
MKTLTTFGVMCAVMASVAMNPIMPTVSAEPVVALGPLPVNLGTAGDFAILTKTGISTTGTTMITGNIGASPIDQTGLTGFSETMDSTNQFSTSDYVVGKLYAADYADPTPAKMTTAVSDMETAFTDAAGRTLPDATELGAGDISGMTLAPGLYKWGTGVYIDNRGVTLSGAASDVWIFQIAQDLTVAETAIVTLSGGAQVSNIFWQVAGGTGVTLGTTSVFYGNILAIKGIVLNTGATLNGRALAQTAVTLDANPVTVPSSVPVSTVDPIISYWKHSSPMTVSATASDGPSGVSNVTLYYRFSSNNLTWGAWTEFGVDNAAPWSWGFTFPNGDGHYELYTRARDNATNFEAAPGSADRRCGFDISAPTSSVNAMASYWKNTSPQNVTATASDATSGVTNVTLYYRYAVDNATWGAWGVLGKDTSSPWSWSITFTNGTGFYEFYTRAFDNATNFEASPGVADQRCGFDMTAPTSGVDAIASYWKGLSPLTVTATVADPTSGVRDVALYFRYAANNATWGQWTVFGVDLAVPWSWSFNFPNGNGYYEFYTLASDVAGIAEAASAAADARCGYDDTAPTSACDIAGAYWRDTAMTITATASDSVSGMGSAELFCRYGAVNGTFGAWMSAGVDAASPWSWSFSFASGIGYYEFFTRATDRVLNVETAPAGADVKYGYDDTVPDTDKPVIGADATPNTVTMGATGATLKFGIVMTDNIGVTEAKVVYQTGTGAWVNQTLTLSGTYQYTISIQSLLSVQYYFYAVDAAGNWQITPTKNVAVHQPAPITVTVVLGPFLYDNGKPVVDALVTLDNGAGRSTVSDRTDASGLVTFDGILPGAYAGSIDKGLAHATFPVTITADGKAVFNAPVFAAPAVPVPGSETFVVNTPKQVVVGPKTVTLTVTAVTGANATTATVGRAPSRTYTKNQPVNVDTDGNGKVDTRVTYLGNDASGNPIIKMDTIAEPQAVKTENNTQFYLAIVVVVLIVVIASVFAVGVRRGMLTDKPGNEAGKTGSKTPNSRNKDDGPA